MNDKCIAGFGEVMLRLTPQGTKRFIQGLPGTLEASFGGGEANVCVSIAMLGGKSKYLTALPKNPVSNAFTTELQGYGVDVNSILYGAGRMGIYYAEHGASQRGSNVVYDREYSTISMAAPEDYDFDAMLDGVNHLHISGITPALSENAFLSTLAITKKAAEKNITISCDLNFRKKLWKWKSGVAPKQLASECMGQIVPLVDWIVCNEEDASDVFSIESSNTSIEEGKIDSEGYIEVAKKLVARFPKVKRVAITLRESYSANHNNWGAMLYDAANDEAFLAPLNIDGLYQPYEIKNIVDRFGGGDSFAAGLIFASYDCEIGKNLQDVLRFAVASSCLKHTISGDYNLTSKSEVLSLMNGSGSGRVAR